MKEDNKNHPVTSALLVHISDYLESGGQNVDLNFPGNDADLMKDQINAPFVEEISKSLLTKSRFKRRRARRRIKKLLKGRIQGSVKITELEDEQATAKNIREKLVEYVKNIQPFESGIFYRSGHGSYILNDITEADGTCEVFCAYDFLIGGFIQDDEFGAIVANNLNKDAFLYVIADTCHAGDSMRSLQSLSTKRGISAPYTAVARTYVYNDKNLKNVVLWAACAPDEVAWERMYGIVGHGAFTKAISKFVPEIVKGTIDLDSAHLEVCTVLMTKPNEKGGQTPQLERYG